MKSLIPSIVASIYLSVCATSGQVAGTTANQTPKIVRSEDGSNVATIYTYSHEPLRDALLLVNREYGWDVNYEEGPVVNPSEIVDDRTEEGRSPHPDGHINYEPNGQPFRSSFKELRPHEADEAAVLAQLLSDYNMSSNPGRYGLVRTSSGGYSVVGTRYKDQNGVEQAFTAPLSCPISITIGPTDLPTALNLVATQVNQLCRVSLSAKYGASFYTAIRVAGTYSHQSAREVIDLLLRQAEGGRLYYSVGYAPVEGVFYLTVAPVFKRVVQPDGGTILVPVGKKSRKS
jgi:hypothetical protein